MKDFKFYREIKNLIGFIRSYGIHHIDFTVDEESFSSLDQEQKDELIRKIHTGFFLAQERVLYLLTKILSEQRLLKKRIKEDRKNRNKECEAENDHRLKKAGYQEFILRKIMDSLVWQIFNFELSDIRRLYCGNSCIDITDSNITSELDYIKSHRSAYPLDFVLINDLTSFHQIGDVTVISPGKGLKIIELKEGKVNEEIFEIIDTIFEAPCPQYLYMALEGKDKKFKEQLYRDIKQIEKNRNVEKILNEGVGFDSNLNAEIKIIQEEFEITLFIDKVMSMIKECAQKRYSFTVIEDCLLVGVYDERKYPSIAFDIWVRSLGIKTDIFDLRRAIMTPLAYPIYLHPFSENTIIDILSGHLVIKLALDMDKFIEKIRNTGLDAKWMTPKETARVNSSLKGKNRIFAIDNCGIKVCNENGRSLLLYDGIILRMYSNFNTPMSAIKYISNSFRHI